MSFALSSDASANEGGEARLSRGLRVGLRVLAVLLVVAIALLLRLRAVDLLPSDYDEDDYIRAAQQYAQALSERDWSAFTELNYRTEHPPLAKIVYGLAIARLPAAEEVPDRPTTAGPAQDLPKQQLTAARISAALAGSLEVLATALLSPLAGLLLAVHTFTIKYTSQVMLEALPALCSAVAVIAYDRSKRRWNGWLILSAAALGFTASGKYLYAVVGLVVVVHWLWKTTPEKRGPTAWLNWLWPVLAWGALALLFFLASNPYLWPDPVGRLLESLLYHRQYSQGDTVQQANLALWQPLVWLAQSVPWHPGVFVVSLDAVITLFAILGVRRLWRKNSLYVIWLAVALLFLFVWPTKWSQYILVLTVPLSLAAAEGAKARVIEPIMGWLSKSRSRDWRERELVEEGSRRQIPRALPWLIPGLVILLLVTFYPLIYQSGMALTDFNALSIKDGINGGIAREVREGLTGQVEPRDFELFSQRSSRSREVHYVGIQPLLQVFAGVGTDLLVFEVVWTVLAVVLQAVLGVSVALLLHRRGLRLRGMWQTIFILPWAIPEFVGALVWMVIADPSYGWFFLGTRTSFSETSGFPLAQTLSQWQQNPTLALLVLLLAGTWLGFPLIMLAASAGLKMIPVEVYDAAAMDGANGWQRFRNITWPLLFPLLAPALIIRGISAFNQFYLFWTLQTPWPVMTFASVSYRMFREQGAFAVSAMVNVLTVLFLVGFLAWFNRQSRAGEGVTYA